MHIYSVKRRENAKIKTTDITAGINMSYCYIVRYALLCEARCDDDVYHDVYASKNYGMLK